jgi:cysteine desulfurase/selenocysteine lyase
MQFWRDQFPIFVAHPELVYLDSAATTQKPEVVLKAIYEHYLGNNANIHRGLYPLAVRATEAYEAARTTVADFIGAQPKEVIFTRNATEALNLLAATLPQTWPQGVNIVLWEGEHHANLIPWQQTGIELRFAKTTNRGEIDLAHLVSLVDRQTVLVSITHCSNVLGHLTPINDLKKMLLQQGSEALICVDACQSLPHIPVDVNILGCDFLVGSGHKLYGPSGIGFLWGRAELLNALPPYQTGGEMINSVTLESATWNTLPWKFEAGTPNIEGAIALAAALNFLKTIGMEEVGEHTATLWKQASTELSAISDLHVLGNPTPSCGIISFTLDGIHPHDLAELLGERNICIRAGHHCAAPLHASLQILASNRISLGLYTTPEDISRAATAIQETIQEVRNA